MESVLFKLTSLDGTVLITNTTSINPNGVSFVAVEDKHGNRKGWWGAEVWGSWETSAATMRDVWASMASGRVVEEDDDEGGEYDVPLNRGSLRCSVDGSYVRVVDTGEDEVAYWDQAEWLDEPEAVMAAIIGAMEKVNG